jgi:hypothetical protein
MLRTSKLGLVRDFAGRNRQVRVLRITVLASKVSRKLSLARALEMTSFTYLAFACGRWIDQQLAMELSMLS